MNFRLFSKIQNAYTKACPDADWCLGDNGDILEVGLGGILIWHNKNNFEVEPYTGYRDVNGKKIYRGDILGSVDGMSMITPYKATVVWREGAFMCEETDGSTMPLDLDNRIWKRHIVIGNIHGADW